MASVNGQLSLVLMITCTFIIPSTQYFSYSDCNWQCRDKGLPCIMIKTIGGHFSTMCIEQDACAMQADEDCPCISDDRPTMGGLKLWMSYKMRPVPTPKPITTPKPQPKPIKQNDCVRWKITSAIQGLISTVLMVSVLFKRLSKWYRSRRDYEILRALINEESPYRSTVENISSNEEVRGHDAEQAHDETQAASENTNEDKQ